MDAYTNLHAVAMDILYFQEDVKRYKTIQKEHAGDIGAQIYGRLTEQFMGNIIFILS